MRKLLTIFLFVIRGVTLVDGTGAPPIGPVDIVIEGNRVREVRSVGFPKVPIKYVMKDGILYDAKKLLHDVEVMVQNAKAAEVKK